MAGPIRIAVLANGAQARADLKQTANAADRIGSRFSKFRLPAVAALGAIGVGAKAAVQAASDLNEEVSKSQQIFGDQAKSIEDFASKAATSLGQSKQSALEATSTFGQIGQKAGLSGKAAADFSKQFTTLASDLASFNNTSPQEAIDAIGSAMRGEAEPIRKYGVLLDDATLRNEALKLGLIKTVKQALTPQQKALAASHAILEQTTKAQGDFARTSTGAANASRVNAARLENLKASLGKGLLPAYQLILQVIGRVAGVMAKHTGLVKIAVVAIAALAATVLIASAATKVYTAGLVIYNGVSKAVALATKAWTVAQIALNFVMTANPIGLVVVAIAALVVGIIIAYKKSETFRKIVDGAFRGISAAAKFMWEHGIRPYFKLISTIWLTVVGVLVNGAAKAFGWVPGIGGKLKKAAEKFNEFKDKVNRALSGVHHDVSVTVHMRLDASKYTAGIKSLPLMPAGTGGRTTTAPRTSTTSPFFSPRTAVLQQPAQPSVVIETVNLQVPVGANGVDIGRELVGHIQTYYAVGGQRL